MADRWIKLYASTVTDTIFNDRDSDTLKVWIWILISVLYKPTTIFIGNQQVELEPGQMLFGRKSAGIKLNIDESKVYRIVKKLERKGCISIESKNKYSVITVTNWSRYQNTWNEDVDNLYYEGQEMNSFRTADEQQMNTIKNKKNIKNDIYNTSSLTPAREEVDFATPKVMGGTLGRNVLVLSEDQMGDLLDLMPLDTFHYYCNKLTDFMINKKRKVNDHYGLILKWFKEDYGRRENFNEQ